MLIDFINFIYGGEFPAILFIFSCFYLTYLITSLHKSKKIYAGINFALPLTLIFWLAINLLPLPPIANQNIKDMLKKQATLGVGSNSLVNFIILGCENNSGYLRGYDYNKILYSYKKDFISHAEGTETFKLKPNLNFNIDNNLHICDYVDRFNYFKFKEIYSNID